MLKQRGCYTIELSDGNKIPLRFCTWTFKRFCEVNGNLSFEKLQESLEEISLPGFISLVLCAAEYEGQDKGYTDRHVCDWIDDMGGMSSPGFIAMVGSIKMAFSDGATANGQEKKSQTVAQ